MHKPPFRFAPTRISLAVALLLVQAPVLHAQTVDNDRTVSIAISAQPLGSALNALSAATGIPIAFPPALVAGKNAAAVQGSLTPRAALTQLMNNSGLEVQQVNGTFVIRAAGTAQQSAAPLPQVVVKAAAENEENLPAAYAGCQVARGSRAGLLGNAKIMDTPFNTTSYTATLMENQQAITVADVLANDPSVRPVSYGLTNSAAGGEIFMIRGLSVQDSILFDGVPGIMSGRASSAEIAERVELLKGPNALLNGMAPGAGGAVGGAINIVPKRADDEPLTRVTTTYMSNSNLAGHLDLGRRFGEDKQWGIRFNGIYRNGDTATSDQSVELGAATLGIDYRGSQLRASLDVGHQTMNNTSPQGSAGFGIADGVEVPSPPSATARIAQSWENTKSRSNFVLAKAEYELSPQWMIYGAVGGSDTQSRYLSTDITVNDSQGDGTANVYFWPNWTRNQVWQGGLRGTVFTGSVKHRLNLSATYLKSDSGYTSSYYGFTSYDTNIYQPVTVAAPSLEGFSSNPPKTNSLQLPSLALSDTLYFMDERIALTLGGRYQRVKSISYDTSGTGTGDTVYQKQAVTPVLAVVFKLMPNLSLYGNYIEGLIQGDTAPVGTTNAGQMFPPVKVKQREIGAKYDFGSFGTSLSLFEIQRPSGFSVSNADGTSTYQISGEQRNRGVELNLFGELARNARLLGGLAYTDARLTKTDSGTYDGNVAPNVSRWQLNLGGEYDVPALAGLTLSTRMISTSSQYIEQSNVRSIPGWTRWDIGMRYTTRAFDKPMVLRASVNNLFNRNYWSSSNGNWVYLGQPRTVILSASVDF
ncbi:TonB-dependent receptor [Herbaspirillum sp. VT-16-41]|uniref:TonB-dependent receptor n=1 Tax=Herbaspirillum sp. VT-16-41 TaxID=1953765 RepID=UPI000980EA5F|nr:TonB-dependent receptor [Herbaspirillum sp. VT-16-41]ONN66721.1 TonB-dependent siderophore receptor [Herbaspirillum sp. VT-16-41]